VVAGDNGRVLAHGQQTLVVGVVGEDAGGGRGAVVVLGLGRVGRAAAGAALGRWRVFVLEARPLRREPVLEAVQLG